MLHDVHIHVLHRWRTSKCRYSSDERQADIDRKEKRGQVEFKLPTAPNREIDHRELYWANTNRKKGGRSFPPSSTSPAHALAWAIYYINSYSRSAWFGYLSFAQSPSTASLVFIVLSLLTKPYRAASHRIDRTFFRINALQFTYICIHVYVRVHGQPTFLSVQSLEWKTINCIHPHGRHSPWNDAIYRETSAYTHA